jgi:hypothetical protein
MTTFSTARTWAFAFGLALLGLIGCGSSAKGPLPLAITSEPTSQSVVAPATATFTVVATGATSYQWYLGGTPIPGATSASYTTPATVTGVYTFSCAVANAAGATQLSAKAALVVSTRASTDTMKGPYAAISYNMEGTNSSQGTLTFDGAGKVSGAGSNNNAGKISPAAYSGTYAIADNGLVPCNLTSPFVQTYIGNVIQNGDAMVMFQFSSSQNPCTFMMIKQGETDFSRASLSGTFLTVGLSGTSDDPSESQDTMTFDGAGHYSEHSRITRLISGTLSAQDVSGTYTVSPTGSITITQAGGGIVTGGLSADGKMLVYTTMTPGEAPTFELAIAEGEANIFNTYIPSTGLPPPTAGTLREAPVVASSAANALNLYKFYIDFSSRQDVYQVFEFRRQWMFFVPYFRCTAEEISQNKNINTYSREIVYGYTYLTFTLDNAYYFKLYDKYANHIRTTSIFYQPIGSTYAVSSWKYDFNTDRFSLISTN